LNFAGLNLSSEETVTRFLLRSAQALVTALVFTVTQLAQDAPSSTPAKSLTAQPSTAEGAAESAEASLEKAVQNPVASLISVPLQNNTSFDLGSYNRAQDVLNIQPVIPINISKDWMVILRSIQPLVWQPYPSLNSGGEYGLGDNITTFFLSPRKPGKVIWGFGPAFAFPTATSTILGQGKFSLGPSAVALAQPGHWTLGALVNNVWSVAGPRERPNVNQMTLQYFITYQLKKGWYITSQPILTANWRAASGSVWTVPFGAGVGRVMKFGFQPVNITAQFYGNAWYPAGGSPWSMRLQIAFLFPKLSKEQERMMMEQRLKQLQ